MKRFLPGILMVALLLCCIPFLLVRGQVFAAAMAGFATVVAVSILLWIWVARGNRYRKTGLRVRFTVNERHTLEKVFPHYNRIPAAQRRFLEERAGFILAESRFDNADQSILKEEDCLLFGMWLSWLVKDLPYNSVKGKVVVFDPENNFRIILQGEKTVFFVNTAAIQREFAQQDPLQMKADTVLTGRDMAIEYYLGR